MKNKIRLYVYAIFTIFILCNCSLEGEKDKEKASYPQTTPLSINSNSLSYNNPDGSITVKLYYNYHYLLWSGVLTTSNPTKTLTSDISYGTVTFKSGATIQLMSSGSNTKMAIINCTINDSGMDMHFNGVILGTWYI